jgi:histidine triad (HIT) family protein
VDACVFCEIVAARRAAHIVHETDETIAFLDQFRQPTDAAHVLVIPRAHVENIYGVDDALGAELFACHALVARAVKAAFAPDGITTWSSNERGANQEVPHFHMHVYPRRVGVPFPPAIQKPEPPVPDELLGASAERIRRAIGDLRAG